MKCKATNGVDLKKVCEKVTKRATTILEQHPQIGSSAQDVLQSLFQSGATPFFTATMWCTTCVGQRRRIFGDRPGHQRNGARAVLKGRDFFLLKTALKDRRLEAFLRRPNVGHVYPPFWGIPEKEGVT